MFLFQQGKTYAEIKDEFYSKYKRKIYDSTISGIIKKEKETRSVEDLNKPGRPSIYSEREERMIIREATKYPLDGIRNLQMNIEVNPNEASKDTLSRIFEKHDVISRVLPGRMSSLNASQISCRKKFAREHK